MRGSLFAIGGREVRSSDGEILTRFVERCGGADARLVVISTASVDPEKREKAVAEYTAAFGGLGVADAPFFHQQRRSDAAGPELLGALDRADGVFFIGGNQLRLATLLGGSALEARIRERHQQGMHLAGTSAGAAVFSAVMIARGRARSAARLAATRMSPGFGIVPGVIIDHHFRERDRFGRLIAAVLCNPSMLGFGLDEDTAFELDADNRATVIGSGSLTIVDASQLEVTNVDVVPEETPAAFAGMRLHVLTQGWIYDLETRSVVPPVVELSSRKPVL